MKIERWYKGNIAKFWHKDEYVKLEYERQPITSDEINMWRDKGYDVIKNFTGVMYDNSNPMPELVKRFPGLFNQYENLTYTFYKMSTLDIMPEHVDHFRTYQKLFDVKHDDVVRILIMLEDWKPGHYLEIDGVAITNWIAGDYYVWNSDVPHASSNIGVEDKYTLQITATKKNIVNIYHTLHYYNIPELETKKVSLEDDLLKYRLLPILEYNNGKPLYIYLYNERIPEIENIEHSAETIEYLNQKGIDIYLYEPLSSYLVGSTIKYPPKGTKHSLIFYSEFSENPKVNNLRSDELDSIQLYVLKNNLTNVTVHTCDYEVEKYYPYYKSFMKLVCDDLFIKSMYPVDVNDTSMSPHFTKKFISLNYRWTPHRHFMSAYLAPLSSHLTWPYRGDMSNVSNQPWTDLVLWSKSNPDLWKKMLIGFEYVNKHAPFVIDLKQNNPINITHPYFRENLPNNETVFTAVKNRDQKNKEKIELAYRDSFVDIVNESRFAQPTANYSEKTIQPMFFKKPFILVAPPFTLKYLRENGFKTFGDYWDESYDECVDHERRMWMIMNLIDEIEKTSIEDLREVYLSMEPILNHNFERLLDIIYAA